QKSDFTNTTLSIFKGAKKERIEQPTPKDIEKALKAKNKGTIGRLISLAENHHEIYKKLFSPESADKSNSPVLGITGTGGAGKSSLVDELVRRFLNDFADKTIGIISVDPSKR